MTIGEYKPMNEDESTEFQIQNYYNTGTMITDQQCMHRLYLVDNSLITFTRGVGIDGNLKVYIFI